MQSCQIAKKIRAAVEASDFSVNHIAKLAGVPQQVLQRFVVGDRANLRLDTAEKVMAILGLSILDTQAEEQRMIAAKRQLGEIRSQIGNWRRLQREMGNSMMPARLVALIDDLEAAYKTLNAICGVTTLERF